MDTAADRGPGPLPAAALSATSVASAPTRGDKGVGAESSLLEPFERVVGTLRRMAGNYTTLAVLDMRRAAVQFAWLVAGGIFIAVLTVTAWLAVVVALAAGLLGEGMSWPAVLLIAAGLNLVGAVLAAFRLRNLFDRAPFDATLRQFKTDDTAGETPSPAAVDGDPR